MCVNLSLIILAYESIYNIFQGCMYAASLNYDNNSIDTNILFCLSSYISAESVFNWLIWVIFYCQLSKVDWLKFETHVMSDSYVTGKYDIFNSKSAKKVIYIMIYISRNKTFYRTRQNVVIPGNTINTVISEFLRH